MKVMVLYFVKMLIYFGSEWENGINLNVNFKIFLVGVSWCCEIFDYIIFIFGWMLVGNIVKFK